LNFKGIQAFGISENQEILVASHSSNQMLTYKCGALTPLD